MHASSTVDGRGLPRAALLAAWGTAALTGGASSHQARSAVETGDEPHQVSVLPGADLGPPATPSLDLLLDALRRRGAGGFRLVLPVPGDVLGLPGPASLNADALEAGECLTTVAAGRPLALLPQVHRFGSTVERGYQVTWRVYPAGSATATDFGGLGEAEQQLRESLASGIDLLEGLDVARARPGAAARLNDLRHGPGPAGRLPPGTSARAVRVVDLAWRVGRVAELARQDDGGSVTGHQAQARSRALRDLQSIARRAVVAAINDAAGPAR
jgi:hypothetical protein